MLLVFCEFWSLIFAINEYTKVQDLDQQHYAPISCYGPISSCKKVKALVENVAFSVVQCEICQKCTCDENGNFGSGDQCRSDEVEALDGVRRVSTVLGNRMPTYVYSLEDNVTYWC
ncbi:unnamed protein product [Acanthoscelides obtectus]|uniref:Uncharacterized protein n=1 Tax=Acanthoscelides obtectus TaxID=200917 RepID=A0A9P0K618_ACAOB|nr:unnamed protein product [Acanthoscelides obtectus]CAK1629046.1 hypothetical protein AOBTE_LOCUS5551 [Acanthoscelides obtectus]